MYKKTLVVNINEGIHTRIAASIVLKTSELKSKYNINLFIKKSNSSSEPFAISMLALLSLKIQKGETIEISCNEDSETAYQAVNEMFNFINFELNSNNTMSKLDAIIEENTIANEQIIDNIPVGIIVIDSNCHIVKINEYALNLIDSSEKKVYGKYIKDIIPTSELPSVLKDRIHQIGQIQHINNNITISNRAPILGKNNEILGAISVFQDISEVIGIQELNEKFIKILEASHDLICFVDEHRKISYLNPAYEKHFNINKNFILGMDLMDISPNGLRIKVFNTKEKLEKFFHRKDNQEIVSTIEPIFIDDKFKGIISISKPINEMKELVSKLERSQEELNYYRDEIRRHSLLNFSFKEIIGNSGSLREVLYIAQKASDSTSTVLIRGESGTGKELIAKAIHYNSPRKNNTLVRVNCAAIPENLLESELFGYEKGAFTGATNSKPGKFNLADKGTIFLDEIGDMPISMQAKLLRVLQDMEFESVGGLKTQKVDVRIIAATNRDLETMIKNGQFREDLYYRLNVINITLPPLRERKEDISLLVEHFIQKLNTKLNKNIKGITNDCIIYLEKYHWPGNIRELENIIERAMNMCDGNLITLKDLPFHIRSMDNKDENLINLVDGELLPLEEYEKEIIKIAMQKYKSFNKAGKALGITHRTVSLKCKKYGIT
ncbi:sigma 54-interacting transcriptional regulator [Haloimpatiens lingqiaonensis]|uniref:sigma 54-interacting transcriptional regulator n=1 Tax=Haloimpatiens lingqiaonensis TaxID=1380675 RepID=UPI0010FD425E|nr:sigma 54-interacting transcriptional regulator [Haloimpatiens lingqiaonensis]